MYHLFVIESEERDRIAARLKTEGIDTGLHYPVPVHRQPAYEHLGLQSGSFPVSERLAQRCLSLPMFPELSIEQVDYVCTRLRAAIAAPAARAVLSAT